MLSVVNMLISPAEGGWWKLDVEALSESLHDQWPRIVHERRDPDAQRHDLWTWPDNAEIWVPWDAECVWVAADELLVSAVAVWLARRAERSLVLCDEGYNEHLELSSKSEDQVRSWMQGHI